jgi:hypothetical protein
LATDFLPVKGTLDLEKRRIAYRNISHVAVQNERRAFAQENPSPVFRLFVCAAARSPIRDR